MGHEMVKTLAHGMPDREGVHWAAQCAEKVSDKLPSHEVEAMKAAQAWAKNPSEANKSAAAAAAAKTKFHGPGSWAAQGAAWAQPTNPAVAKMGSTAVPRLTPHAVTGAVLLSAAIKVDPKLAVPSLQPPKLEQPVLAAPNLQAPQISAPKVQHPDPPPEVQAKAFKDQHPFIALGLDIASGKNSCG